ncbi:MAG: hypothetical protein ACR2OO_10110 [Thermomicrobiales bacterium]
MITARGLPRLSTMTSARSLAAQETNALHRLFATLVDTVRFIAALSFHPNPVGPPRAPTPESASGRGSDHACRRRLSGRSEENVQRVVDPIGDVDVAGVASKKGQKIVGVHKFHAERRSIFIDVDEKRLLDLQGSRNLSRAEANVERIDVGVQFERDGHDRCPLAPDDGHDDDVSADVGTHSLLIDHPQPISGVRAALRAAESVGLHLDAGRIVDRPLNLALSELLEVRHPAMSDKSTG